MNLLSYKHIIWDWNGTLLNDVDLCVSIMCRILEARNLPVIDKDHYKNIFTFPVVDYYKYAGLNLTEYKFKDLSVEFINDYELNKFSCSLYENAEESLKYFSDAGISQSILSAYSQYALEEIVSHFGIRKYFEKLNGLENIYAESKIAIGKRLTNELALHNYEVLLIGDSIHDYEVAKEIGADVILVSQGHQSHRKLLTCNTPVIKNLKQLSDGIC
jgi:phosphoglycolate phosphatase